MADMTMIWNAILTMAIGGFLWWIRSTSAAISKVKDELAKAKEQMALNYATNFAARVMKQPANPQTKQRYTAICKPVEVDLSNKNVRIYR
jgi:hypothetical protein